MKKVLIPVLLLMSTLLHAANYYISTSGDDTRTTVQAQASATPWKSLSKISTLTSGDKVFLKRGDVFNSILPQKSGVSIDAYGFGATPVITGLTTVSTWFNEGGGIYSTTLSIGYYLNTVVVNNNVQPMGRYPNTGYLTYSATSSNTTITGVTLPFNPNGAEVVIKKQRDVIDRHKISGYTAPVITYISSNTTDNPLKSGTSYSPTAGYGYFIQNCMQALDVTGDWYYDRTAGKLYMYFGASDPVNFSVKVSNIDVLSTMNNLTNITLRNLTFEGANSYGIQMISATGIVIDSCNFLRMGGYGIRGDGSNVVKLKNSYLYDCNNDGFFFEQANTSLIYNNIVDNNALHEGMMWSGNSKGFGMNIEGNTDTIRANTLTNIGYHALYFRGSNVIVDSNYVDNYCVLKGDGGGIYTYLGGGTADLTGDKVYRNTVLNGNGTLSGVKTGASEGVHAIYLDGFTSSVEVAYNNISRAQGSGIYVNLGHNNNIHDNNLFDCTELMLFEEETAGTIYGNSIHDNTFTTRSASQMVYQFNMNSTNTVDYVNFATYSNNVYTRPISQSTPMMSMRYLNGANNTSYTVAQWKTHVSDATAKTSTVSVTDPTKVQFKPNVTRLSSALGGFCAFFYGVYNETYTGRTVVQPHHSLTYIKP